MCAISPMPVQVRRIKAELEPLGHSEKTQEKKSLLRGLLRVTVVAARNLPRMDILRSTDAYCLVFLSEPYGESGATIRQRARPGA